MTPAEARALLASLPEGATAGPWANVGYPLRGIDGPEIMGPGDQLLCTLDNHPNDLANAALIAAAPALRDALGEALGREEREATKRRAADQVLAEIAAWTCVYGAALKPTGADSYGEGMRAAKAQIANILRVRLIQPPTLIFGVSDV